MATKRSRWEERSRRAWDLARRQHGILTRRQLLGLGFSTAAIKHRLATGRLHPLWRGVYAVGWSQLTRKQHWMAAVRACGEEAMLSHGSAAALWGIGSERPGLIDVTVRRLAKHHRRGLAVRSRPALPAEDVTERSRIPVTCPARTLLDLATLLTPIRLERAVNDTDKHDLIDIEELRDWLEGRAGEPGVRKLRTLIDRRTFRLSDSDLEIQFRRIVRAMGLPPPQPKPTSTASRSISTGPISAWWSKPTASPTTARRSPRTST